MNENYKTFCRVVGLMIKEHRVSQGIKGVDLAKKIGISPITYRNYENGQRLFSPYQLDLIGHYLDFDIAKEVELLVDRLLDSESKEELIRLDIAESVGSLQEGISKEDINSKEEYKDIILANREIQRHFRKRKNFSERNCKNSIDDAIRFMEEKYAPIEFLQVEDKTLITSMCVGLIENYIQSKLKVGKFERPTIEKA